MGSKTQANTKDKSNTCEECARDFQTLSALKSHTMAKHPEKYKLMQINAAVNNDDKTAFVPPISRVSMRLQKKKSSDTRDIEAERKSSNTGSQSKLSKRKTIFECPKCLQEFSVYFSALKHIQKRHCEDKDGNPVPPDSPNIIKPKSKEINTGSESSSNKISESHDNGTYCCLACKQTFHNVASFDEHVEGNHKDKVNKFILENMNEFLVWKTNVESKLKVKYLTLSNTLQKQYYQCNYVSSQNSANMTHLCPSMMIVREVSKGIHICYYKDHYEHVCESSQHSKDLNSVPDQAEVFDDVIMSGEDVYSKLKDLMKNVVQKAHMLKRIQLKPLYISALEMQAYLNSVIDKRSELTSQKPQPNIVKPYIETLEINSNQDNENYNESKNKIMNDDEITKALEAPRVSARLKRKSEGSPVPETKKNKLDKEPSKKTGLKENNSQNKDLQYSERFESPRPSMTSPFSQSPSFNDTYKQFIEGSSPKLDPPIARKVKKEIVKTKIGQFSPKKLAQVKDDTAKVENKKKKKEPVKSNTSLDNLKIEDVEYEVVEQENDCNILILKL